MSALDYKIGTGNWTPWPGGLQSAVSFAAVTADSWIRATFTSAATVPILDSPTSASIAQTSATLGARITSDGGAAITSRGTCWGTVNNAANLTNCATEGGTAVSVFSHARSPFTCNTTYYYHGYAVNNVGTGYSGIASFTTSACAGPVAPVCGTNPASCDAGTWADVIDSATQYKWQCTGTNGNATVLACAKDITYTVTTWAGPGCTVTPGPTTWSVPAGSYLGVNFGANPGYSISDVTVNGVTQGVLDEYIVSSVGQNFNIAVTCDVDGGISIPTVTNRTTINITETSATLRARVASDGGSPITGYGTCWGTVNNPANLTNCVLQGGLPSFGDITHDHSGFTCNTTYYHRGHAVNIAGTGYSGIANFTTSACSPRPDLIPYKPVVQASGTLEVDSSVTFLSAVQNVGNAPSVLGTRNTFEYGFSSTGPWNFISHSYRGNLDPGDYASDDISDSLYLSFVSTYYIRYCVESQFGIPESDETNNCDVRSFIVTDLPSGPVAPVCGTNPLVCQAGTWDDVIDSATQYKWQCTGRNGDATVLACAKDITYTVTTSAGTGCTVTPGPTTWSVPAGSYLGVNFGANAGYSISDVTVNGVSQGVLNEYNVNNVWQNFNIAVTCVPVAIPAALNICPPSAILGTGGQTQQLQAWYTPAGTSFIDCGNTTGASDAAGTASWSSSSSAVATVSTSGLVTSAGASGQSTDVTAVYAGVNDSAAITLTCIQNVFCTAATQGAVCEGETYTFIDNCGVPHDCDGTRSCNYNWKEVAP